MALRNIRFEDDELLRKKSKPVKEITESIITLLGDMRETLADAGGVGLAAPQVGVLRRIAIVDAGEERGTLELINPEIIECRGSQTKREGCLSVPGVTGKVKRPEYVKIKYFDRDFNERTAEGEEMLAVCFCHEIDHLDGILYTDKATDIRDMEDDEQ